MYNNLRQKQSLEACNAAFPSMNITGLLDGTCNYNNKGKSCTIMN